MKTNKYRIIIRNIPLDGATVHDIVLQELGKVEIVDWWKEGEVNFQGDCGAGSQRHVYVMVKYREIPKKTEEKATRKKPAHEVVVDMLESLVSSFVWQIRDGAAADPKLMADFGTLKRLLADMIIPAEHVNEVVDRLRQIKKVAYEAEYGTRINSILPESLFAAIES